MGLFASFFAGEIVIFNVIIFSKCQRHESDALLQFEIVLLFLVTMLFGLTTVIIGKLWYFTDGVVSLDIKLNFATIYFYSILLSFYLLVSFKTFFINESFFSDGAIFGCSD
jgi:hypothetical protein